MTLQYFFGPFFHSLLLTVQNSLTWHHPQHWYTLFLALMVGWLVLKVGVKMLEFTVKMIPALLLVGALFVVFGR
jgi:hypothetical protein